MLEEMDLPAILRRAPELCLIDELAHTNAPGVEHEKRYEDIEDVLAAGIDVFSTVNVQHLESLNDQVAELTGIRVRETVPDAVIGVGRRGRADRHHAAVADRAAARRQGLLRRARPGGAEQLLQGREPLRAARGRAAPGRRGGRGQAAPGRAGRRPGDERLIDTAAPQAVGERLLALVKPQPKSQRIVRRAWRSAQRLGAELDLLWVTDHEPSQEEQEQLDALRRLASVLGAHLLVEHGDDVALVTQRVARDRGTTYVLMGTPKPRSALRRLTTPALPYRLLAAAARRRPADRRRPLATTEGGVVTTVLIALVVVLAVALRRSRPCCSPSRVRRPARRNVTPRPAGSCSRSSPMRCPQRALDAALRLAHAEDATLVPIFLARVPLHLPLDAPLPRQSGDRDPAAGGDRAACDRVRRTRSTRGSSAAAPIATRSGRRSPTSASTGS